MKKVIFLLILGLIHFFFNKMGKIKSKTLIISFFFISIPFQFDIPFYKINMKSTGGTLGTTISITLPIVFLLVFALSKNFRLPAKLKGPNALILSGLFLIALFNPFNISPLASLLYVIFVTSNLFCFLYFANNFTIKQIVDGLFLAFYTLSVVQMILAICFPVLNISYVTTMFFDGAGDWSTRNGQRNGAVGVFITPGDLGLFCTVASVFFLACVLNNHKRRLSMVLIGVNLVITFLSYSRTSYLTALFVLFFTWFVFKNSRKNLFSIRNILAFGVPISLLLIWVIDFSPLSDLFLQSNVSDMYQARLMHWLMALEIFQSHPIIGVGLNDHLEYVSKKSNIMKSVDVNNDFLLTNPIHNIHLILLSETGLAGIIFWLSLIIRNIKNGKAFLARFLTNNDFIGHRIIVLSALNIVVVSVIYGITGWAPFSEGFFPYLLFFMFFSFYMFQYYAVKKVEIKHVAASFAVSES